MDQDNKLGPLNIFTSATPTKRISHKLEQQVNHEKKTKYTQLYQTFKKSLGINAGDIGSKQEFDQAFNQLVT